MMAAATGIRAEKILDFATPRFLMVLTQSENARLEQRIERQIIGYQTSAVKCGGSEGRCRHDHFAEDAYEYAPGVLLALA